MIWAPVSSRSCFCWLYRASPSLAAKNIINLISVLTIYWCLCVESSCVVVGRGCLLWPVYSLGKTLLAFALFILYSKAKLACYSRHFLTSYFCIAIPYDGMIWFFIFAFLLLFRTAVNFSVHLWQYFLYESCCLILWKRWDRID